MMKWEMNVEVLLNSSLVHVSITPSVIFHLRISPSLHQSTMIFSPRVIRTIHQQLIHDHRSPLCSLALNHFEQLWVSDLPVLFIYPVHK
ncbi:hypothetical protein OIU79_025036 [Salix purpurea]|uniref:Uncharacterized protein n=1 Tax=Salix purpurea TaxID=77065 RepID=A0A9Q0W6H8_SALPP|nr:hypothetical protein OIU79_025036 [Salix purpurea]